MVEKSNDRTRRKKKNNALFKSGGMKKFKPLRRVLLAVVLALVLCAVMILIDNSRITVRKIRITHEQVPEAFDGYRILQISDLKGKSFGRNDGKLTKLADSLQYDCILLTGDYLSASGDLKELDPLLAFLHDRKNQDAPVYFILGENDDIPEPPEGAKRVSSWNMCIQPNTENRVAAALEEAGAIPVYPIQMLERGDDRIFLTGISYKEKLFDSYGFDTDKDFTVCVTHKPIDYDVDERLSNVNRFSFREVDFDLALSGHTLAGVVRLPILGTVYLQGYGLFPQESVSYGLQRSGRRYTYITSGLGTNGGIRIFNTPEIALIELHKA